MKKTAQVSTRSTLEEIQHHMREMCEPHYDEFHKVTSERGFLKITIPQQQRRK